MKRDAQPTINSNWNGRRLNNDNKKLMSQIKNKRHRPITNRNYKSKLQIETKDEIINYYTNVSIVVTTK